MNKTVQSIVSLTAFSALLIVITLFCGGLGFGRLFRIYGIMEYCFLGLLIITDVTVIYKVYKLYAMHPKVIMLLLALECCSVILWLAFICIDQSLLDWQITNFILHEPVCPIIPTNSPSFISKLIFFNARCSFGVLRPYT